MSGGLALATHLLALLLMGAMLAIAVAAMSARSLLAMCAHLAVAGALAAAVVLLLRGGDGALAVALFATAWAPIHLLGALLLSTRTAKPLRGGRVLASALAAAAAGAAMLWPLRELAQAGATAPAPAHLGFWMIPIVFAAAATSVGLLGYGERGALGRGR